MDRPWFNPETGMLILDEYVAQIPSYQRILADQQVTSEEVKEQSERVIVLLKELEAKLSPEMKELTTTTLCELAVLYAVQRHSVTSAR